MTTKKYLDFVISKLEEVKKTQIKKIEKASDMIVESCIRDGRFYIFGSGHSHMIAEELYIRAGGLAYVKAILPPELMLHEMPNKSTHLERMDGYAKSMLELHKVDSNDTLMVISNSGRNSVPVEMCLHAKEIGANVIALTSLKHTMEVSSRHKSGKNIYQIADVVIDNCADRGDAAFYVKNFDVPTGPTSSVTGRL